jgi:hypothetical protein
VLSRSILSLNTVALLPKTTFTTVDEDHCQVGSFPNFDKVLSAKILSQVVSVEAFIATLNVIVIFKKFDPITADDISVRFKNF